MNKSAIKEYADLIGDVIPKTFTAAEIARAEASYPALSPDQPANLCGEFETVEAALSLQLTAETLGAVEKEFLLISGWHQSRGRESLADRYRRCAYSAHLAMTRNVN
ncbi:MAG TPA: hypothetical protein VG273_24105 [Bryobacteraceae bacterium]|jgi:hypothetical protein|nr:hypothetical protein [Bryobacteraceae bacterium]